MVVVDYCSKWVELFALRDAKLISSLCESWGVARKLTTAYHPQTNLTERVNRTLKTTIASFVDDHLQDWDW